MLNTLNIIIFLGGILNLVNLLNTENLEILRNSCGCLKNLAFGKNNDENKVKNFFFINNNLINFF